MGTKKKGVAATIAAMVLLVACLASEPTATAVLKADATVGMTFYAGKKHKLRLDGVKAGKVAKTKWRIERGGDVVRFLPGTKGLNSVCIRGKKGGYGGCNSTCQAEK